MLLAGFEWLLTLNSPHIISNICKCQISILGMSGYVINPYPAVHNNPAFANSVDPDQMASEEAI